MSYIYLSSEHQTAKNPATARGVHKLSAHLRTYDFGVYATIDRQTHQDILTLYLTYGSNNPSQRIHLKTIIYDKATKERLIR